MRKLSSVIIIALLSFLGFSLSCSEDNEDAKLSISIQRLSVPGDGDSVQVDVKSDCGWNAESSDDWCVVSPKVGKGNGKMTVVVKRNPSTESGRKASVLLVSKKKSRETVALQINQEKLATYVLKVVSQSVTMGTVEGSGTYESGKEVTIKAVANPNYAFAGWSDGNRESVRTVIVKQGMTLEAKFTPLKYTLSLLASPATGGSVTGGGTYDYNSRVTVKATPATGYTFSKWSDGVTTISRTVTVDGNKTLTAIFTTNKYVLTLNASPTVGGSVTGGGAYDYNRSVTIKATPATGYTFSKWSDGNTLASRTITVKDNQTLTAIFTPIKYSLSLSAGTGGSVTGGGSYEYNSSVTIKATPATGYVFSEWSDGNTSASRTIIVKENQSLTARFVKAVYKITLTASPSEGGEVSGDGSYEHGTSVTLKAVPNEGYTFFRWSDGVSTNPRTITVTQSMSVYAVFTKEGEDPDPFDKSLGKLPGKFSVSATKQVSFSMGNLQYQASTKTWRFAENQYDVIGTNNKYISSTYSGWIDLFGWGTSEYNSKYPYMTSTTSTSYGNGSSNIAGTNYDWGVYNAISNGGNKAGMWRTLTYNEWNYLYGTRISAANLRGKATVNGRTGYVLLPDGWSIPSGLTFTANPSNYTTNIYSASEWSKMEAAGAVFLPCAGYRNGTDVRYVDFDGYYWSSTADGNYGAYYFYFHLGDAVSNYRRGYGSSVRLATE